MRMVSKTALPRHPPNQKINEQLYPLDKMDPSDDLNESTWNDATQVGPGLYTEGTFLWKNSTALFQGPEVEKWTSMKDTGQWKIPKGWFAYLTGGEIRAK